MKHAFFHFLTAVLVVVLAVVADLLLGQFHDIGEIRIAARQFREEAALLRSPTKNLVPGIDHIYLDPGVSKDADGHASIEIRRFRTDRSGVVISRSDAPPNAKKILFLGGSTTECNEVAEPFRFTAVVERSLREAGLNVVTLNAGVRGHTTQDSINSLFNRPGFRDAEVEVVVLMHNINDRVRLGIRGNYDATLGTDGATTGRVVINSAKLLMSSVWDYLTYRSNSLFLIRYWGNKTAAWLDQPQNPEITEKSINFMEGEALKNLTKFEENLIVFVRLVRAIGKRPVLMTQPLGRYSAAQDKFNDTIRSVASREQVPLVDLDRELGQDRGWAFFSDNIHFNTRGSTVIGKNIAVVIAPLFGISIEKLKTVQ